MTGQQTPLHTATAGKLLTWMGSSVSFSLRAVLPSPHFDPELYVRRRLQSRKWFLRQGREDQVTARQAGRVSVASPTPWLLFLGSPSATPSRPARALSLSRTF